MLVSNFSKTVNLFELFVNNILFLHFYKKKASSINTNQTGINFLYNKDEPFFINDRQFQTTTYVNLKCQLLMYKST